MDTRATAVQSDDVIEIDGMLWKPKRGATTSADEFAGIPGYWTTIRNSVNTP
jgi:hypothetical protein